MHSYYIYFLKTYIHIYMCVCIYIYLIIIYIYLYIYIYIYIYNICKVMIDTSYKMLLPAAGVSLCFSLTIDPVEYNLWFYIE